MLPYLCKSYGSSIQPSDGGITDGVHLFPFRTEQLSPSWPMILVNSGKVGSCHIYLKALVIRLRLFFIIGERAVRNDEWGVEQLKIKNYELKMFTPCLSCCGLELVELEVSKFIEK